VKSIIKKGPQHYGPGDVAKIFEKVPWTSVDELNRLWDDARALYSLFNTNIYGILIDQIRATITKVHLLNLFSKCNSLALTKAIPKEG
jgi:hypothetical protein